MIPEAKTQALVDIEHREKVNNNAAPNWWNDKGMRKLAIAQCAAYCATINAGFDGSLFNGLQTMPIYIQAIGNPGSSTLGLIGASFSLGALFSLIPGSWASDRFGRRWVMAAAASFMIAGCIIQTAVMGQKGQIAGRVIAGFGNSLEFVSAPAYLAEISHPRNRPRATALLQTCYFIGGITCAWTTFGTLSLKSDWCWRLPTLLQLVPGTIQLALLCFSRDSPRWLIKKGRSDEALNVLATYHANGDENDELVQLEMQEITEALAIEALAEHQSTYRAFLKTKGNRRRLLIVLGIGFSASWVGNGIVSYYLASMLEQIGITSSSQQAGLNGGLQIISWIAAIAGALLCERLGRRTIWLMSACIMLLTFTTITITSAIYAERGVIAAGYATIPFIFLYNVGYAIGFTPMQIAYPQEILSYGLRTKGIAIQMLVVQGTGFFNTYVNPIALGAIGWKYYIVYDVIIAAVIAYIYLLYPETKGLMLEEIAVLIDGPDANVQPSSPAGLAEERKVVDGAEVTVATVDY